MRLDFKVLWVDDQPDYVQSQVGVITKQMEVEGFQFNPTICHSLDDVRERISDNVFTDAHAHRNFEGRESTEPEEANSDHRASFLIKFVAGRKTK